jgi:hypothetical protein
LTPNRDKEADQSACSRMAVPNRTATVSDCVKSQAEIAALADRHGWPVRIIS